MSEKPSEDVLNETSATAPGQFDREYLDRLITGFAHDVRNPLNSVLAAVSMLEVEAGAEPEARRLFEGIRIQVRRIASLLQALTDITRPLDRSRVERFPAEALCREAVALWRGRHPDEPAERIRVEPLGHTEMIDVEPLWIETAIARLLDNAHQHSAAESEVCVRISEVEGQLHIAVIDHGTGVEPQRMSRVFDPFFTTVRGAHGLGLTLVKNIVEQHRGSITLTNNESGPGCTAEIVLPVVGVPEPAYAAETSAR